MPLQIVKVYLMSIYSTSKRKEYRNNISMFMYGLSKDVGDIYDCSKAALCTFISSIATIITTIFVCLLSTIRIPTAIIICIITIIFSILFFILYKRDKMSVEIEYVTIKAECSRLYISKYKDGVLKSRRNRKILYNSHIKTLYKMYRISDKFETEEAEEAFIKEFVNDEVEALKNTLNELAEEMAYETKLKDEEILKANTGDYIN